MVVIGKENPRYNILLACIKFLLRTLNPCVGGIAPIRSAPSVHGRKARLRASFKVYSSPGFVGCVKRGFPLFRRGFPLPKWKPRASRGEIPELWLILARQPGLRFLCLRLSRWLRVMWEVQLPRLTLPLGGRSLCPPGPGRRTYQVKERRLFQHVLWQNPGQCTGRPFKADAPSPRFPIAFSNMPGLAFPTPFNTAPPQRILSSF